MSSRTGLLAPAAISALLFAFGIPVHAEGWFPRRKAQPECCPPVVTYPGEIVAPTTPMLEVPPTVPSPGMVESPPLQVPAQPGAQQPMPLPAPAATDSSLADAGAFSDIGFAATGSSLLAANDSIGGYIDNAVPATMFRLRFDSAFNNVRPDRAEFFYPQCGCFGPPAAGPGLIGVPETSVDYQEIAAYFEYMLVDRLSMFIEVPFRFLNPAVNNNTAGVSDVQAGLKYAIIQDVNQVLTFQLRHYFATGDGDRGLGTSHNSLEPGFLYLAKLTDRITLQGELREWLSLDGTANFEGSVLRYGAGLGYDIYQLDDRRVTPIIELVGWTVTDGRQFEPTAPGAIGDADGITIFNAKVGVRGTIGNNSLYLGFGHALSDDTWYEDIFRAEYRLAL